MINVQIAFVEGEPVSIKALNQQTQESFDEYCSIKGAIFYPQGSINSLQLQRKFWIWLMLQVEWLASDKTIMGDLRSIAHLLELIWIDAPKRKPIIDGFILKSEENGNIANIYQPISNNRVETESPPSDEGENSGDLWENSEGGD